MLLVTPWFLPKYRYAASSWREEQQKGEMRFFENYSTSRTYTFWGDQYGLNAGVFEFLFCIRPIGKRWPALNREH